MTRRRLQQPRPVPERPSLIAQARDGFKVVGALMSMFINLALAVAGFWFVWQCVKRFF